MNKFKRLSLYLEINFKAGEKNTSEEANFRATSMVEVVLRTWDII